MSGGTEAKPLGRPLDGGVRPHVVETAWLRGATAQRSKHSKPKAATNEPDKRTDCNLPE